MRRRPTCAMFCTRFSRSSSSASWWRRLEAASSSPAASSFLLDASSSRRSRRTSASSASLLRASSCSVDANLNCAFSLSATCQSVFQKASAATSFGLVSRPADCFSSRCWRVFSAHMSCQAVQPLASPAWNMRLMPTEARCCTRFSRSASSSASICAFISASASSLPARLPSASFSFLRMVTSSASRASRLEISVWSSDCAACLSFSACRCSQSCRQCDTAATSCGREPGEGEDGGRRCMHNM